MLSRLKQYKGTPYSYSLNLLLTLILFQNCSYTEVGKPAPEINVVKNGKKFFINLPENHKEFRMWKLSDDHDKKIVEDINAVWHGNEKGVDYHFKALAPGSDTLTFTEFKYNEQQRYISFIVKVE